ncbi:MAG TPA: hypothetical protein VGQ41_06595 [Pyrinomonadaceae bacterium]|jgi:hypothetical protein|nr:hypothetical protein [Pyrinomonadaceae bacterium]
MPQNSQTQPNKSVQGQENNNNSERGLWIIIGVGAVLLVAVVVIGGVFIDTGRVRFITEFSLTVLLAALVAVQAYIYRKQWEVMGQQRVEIEKQAGYMLESLKSTREHTIHTLRAYVNIRLVVPDFPKQILMEIVNFGQTPAHNVQFAHMIAVKPFQEIPEASPESVDWVIPGVPLAPTMSIEKPLLLGKISEADMAKLHDPQYRLFVWGVIRYEDVFYKTRYTRFSAFYVPLTRKIGTCSKGNDAN